jgi:hypothetical protein
MKKWQWWSSRPSTLSLSPSSPPTTKTESQVSYLRFNFHGTRLADQLYIDFKLFPCRKFPSSHTNDFNMLDAEKQIIQNPVTMLRERHVCISFSCRILTKTPHTFCVRETIKTSYVTPPPQLTFPLRSSANVQSAFSSGHEVWPTSDLLRPEDCNRLAVSSMAVQIIFRRAAVLPLQHWLLHGKMLKERNNSAFTYTNTKHRTSAKLAVVTRLIH